MTSEQSYGQSLNWFKSSYSGGSGGDCVEVAGLPASVHVRDSKDTGQGTFTVAPATWSAFVAYASHAH
ncbi:DUF397 domain-containing protein [Streptomyces sp. GD-15H]|uniref:DUF397 domain-containing protein n=1 Tax=Streptomyces sp. GD-15H TaxID=3129112 RepID=UPI0032477AE3